MKISIKSDHFPLTDALRNHIERRLKFALRFGEEDINKVVLRLSDINGPRGGVDKCCQVLAVVNGMNDVVVTDIEDDMYSAINRASHRAGRTIRKKLARRRYLSVSVNRSQIRNGDNTDHELSKRNCSDSGVLY
jgi:ribosomal subunit interface protein